MVRGATGRVGGEHKRGLRPGCSEVKSEAQEGRLKCPSKSKGKKGKGCSGGCCLRVVCTSQMPSRSRARPAATERNSMGFIGSIRKAD